MATEFSFELSEPVTALQLGQVLASTIANTDMAEQPPHWNGGRFDQYLASWVWVASGASGSLPFPDPLQELFGFTAAARVLFRLEGDDRLDQKRDMLRLVAAVLDAFPGDAWLAYAGEITYLLRSKGRLTIDMDLEWWPPEVTDLLPPHDVAPLPNM